MVSLLFSSASSPPNVCPFATKAFNATLCRSLAFSILVLDPASIALTPCCVYRSSTLRRESSKPIPSASWTSCPVLLFTFGVSNEKSLFIENPLSLLASSASSLSNSLNPPTLLPPLLLPKIVVNDAFSGMNLGVYILPLTEPIDVSAGLGSASSCATVLKLGRSLLLPSKKVRAFNLTALASIFLLNGGG